MSRGHDYERKLKQRLADRATLERRFWAKVAMGGSTDCWTWKGAMTPAGYGHVTQNKKKRGVHRVAYEWLVGPISDGLVLDHLCENPSCVNPAHLEPVTQQANSARAYGNTCKHGHPLDGYQRSNGGIRRYCLTCNKERCRRKYWKRKAAMDV